MCSLSREGLRRGVQQVEGAIREEARAVFNTILVEGDPGMVEKIRIVLGCFCAEEIELAGDGAGIEGEVLANEVGQALRQVGMTKYFFVYGCQFVVQGFIV